MNNQIKILLTIQGISGRTLRPLGKKKVKWSMSKKDIDPNYKGKDALKPVSKGSYIIMETEQIPCSQSIKMTQDAYDYMTSSEQPDWFKGNWKAMNKKQRLEVHLQRTCEDRGGKSFTYSILEN